MYQWLGPTRLVYLLRGLNGLTTGFLILWYARIIGNAVARQAGWNSDSFSYFSTALMFTFEYFLQVKNGAVFNRWGARASFGWSFFLRSLYGGLICWLATASDTLGTAMCIAVALAAIVLYSMAFTLFAGNVEAYLRSNIGHENDFAFPFAMFSNYVGLIVGASLSLWAQESWSAAAYALLALIGVAISLQIPPHTPRAEAESLPKPASLGEIADASRDFLREDKPLSRLFWLSAACYGGVQSLATVMPILILGRTDVMPVEKLLILVVASYGPSLLGSICAALRRMDVKPTLRDTAPLWLSATAIAPVYLFVHGRVRWWITGLLITLIRFTYGRLEPAIQAACANRSRVSPYSATVLGYGERRKTIGPIFSLILATFVTAIRSDAAALEAAELWTVSIMGALITLTAWQITSTEAI